MEDNTNNDRGMATSQDSLNLSVTDPTTQLATQITASDSLPDRFTDSDTASVSLGTTESVPPTENESASANHTDDYNEQSQLSISESGRRGRKGHRLHKRGFANAEDGEVPHRSPKGFVDGTGERPRTLHKRKRR